MANVKGAKPDKLMRNALLLELHQDVTLSDGQKVKVLRDVARALIAKALEGDVSAIKEINDRVDGKVPQAVQHEGGDTPVDVNLTLSPVEAAKRVAFVLRAGAEAMKAEES